MSGSEDGPSPPAPPGVALTSVVVFATVSRTYTCGSPFAPGNAGAFDSNATQRPSKDTSKAG